MEKRNFRKMLEAQWDKGNFVCVGLDSELSKIPESVRDRFECMGGISETISVFNREIIEATKDIACAYKPNIAFYEEHGEDGIIALRRTVNYIRKLAPDVPVILDAKRADIGNTNAGYMQMAFKYLEADAITVHPYLGAEALEPFLSQMDKGIIVLCRTSNPGAGEFQDLPVHSDPLYLGEPLYHYIARSVAIRWNKNNNCAIVVGATYPDELKKIRRVVGDLPILIPGIGFQQKDVPLEKQVEQVVSAGQDSRGRGMIINSSRGIIFASKGADFAEAARRETKKLHNLINKYRNA